MARFDMYEAVTKRVIEMMENGIIPWEKPWKNGRGAWSRRTGKPYTLINQFLLDGGEYATLGEIKQEGGELVEGAEVKYVWSFWTETKRVEETNEETGEVTERTFPKFCSKYYKVYNIATDTTLEIKHDNDAPRFEHEPNEIMDFVIEDYRTRSGVGFNESERSSACYSPMYDEVRVPRREQFEGIAEFYSVVFHELGHSTGHEYRLKRFNSLDSVMFGDNDYSREELVAELTSCAVLSSVGIETEHSFRNNTAYIRSWLEVLKNDSKVLITASKLAEKAYNLIMNIETESADK